MKQKRSFLKNTIILFAAMFFSKGIGAILKIPLANILGGIGMGYFSTAYSLFTPVYALVAAGLPTVVAKLTAQNAACCRYRNIRLIKKSALRLGLLCGIAGTAAIALLAIPFSVYAAGSVQSSYAIFAIAPSVIFCCIAAAYKGYYEGLCDMLPTAASQIAEAVVKAIFGLALSYGALILFKDNENVLAIAAAAAIGGVTLSEICGTLTLMIHSKIKPDGITESDLEHSPAPQSSKAAMMQILREALPISIGAVVINLGSFIDMLTIPSCVNLAAANNIDYFLQYFVYGNNSGIKTDEIGNFIYGSYSGIVNTLFMLIPSMTGLLCKSCLPQIAGAAGKGDGICLEKHIKLLFQGTFVIGLPLCFVLGTLAEPVLNLLYNARPAEAAVSVMPLTLQCFSGIVFSISAAQFAVFQSIGRSDLPVKLTLPASALKLLLNYLLIPIPELNVSGAVISTAVSYGLVCIIAAFLIKKETGVRFVLIRTCRKSLAAAVLSAFTAFCSYEYLFCNFSDFLRLCFSGIAAGTIYCVIITLIDRKFMFSSLIQRKNQC